MSEFGPASAALLALGLALAAALAALLMGLSRSLAKYAHWPVVGAFGVGAVLAAYALVALAGGEGPASSETEKVTWFRVGSVRVAASVRVDPISAVMACVITGVGTCIAVFSAGYMKGDGGYARYFALMALFVASMLLLVLAPDLLLMVAGWEGVGVCSYLLVGYYYAKPSAAAAARKAFLVTRLGDVGMILGIFYLWEISGGRTDFEGLFRAVLAEPETHWKLNVACLLLFCGAVGKSAQLPLYVWLPDAMEGPTPVSALIHAATMVTAGVYLLARCAPLFVLAPAAQAAVTAVGAATALVAGFLAVGQNDLKRVLAYSTVSQLGFMFMALGTGGLVPPSVAVAAALFHLVTHAFFKALLFLGSGSVMHAMGNVIDMRRFGGLSKLMPVTHWTFVVGAAALAGVPFLSGFWSKDAVLDTLFEAGESGDAGAGGYLIALGAALAAAGLTGFYTFRAYFLTFRGELRVPEEAGHHAHESPAVMTWPLVVLAVGALFAGAILDPLTHAFSEFVGRTPSLLLANAAAGRVFVAETAGGEPVVHFNLALALISSAVALMGVALAWGLYAKGGPEEVPAGLRSVYALSRHRLYVDEVYYALFVRPAELFAAGCRQLEPVLDGVARLASAVPRLAGAGLRPLQNGLVQFYALGMVLGLAVFLTVVVVRTSR